jgi:hypothetical protein
MHRRPLWARPDLRMKFIDNPVDRTEDEQDLKFPHILVSNF